MFFFLFFLFQGFDSAADRSDGIAQALEEMRFAKSVQSLERAFSRARIQMSLELLCEQEKKGAAFPVACLKVLRMAPNPSRLASLEKSCRLNQFPPRSISLFKGTGLSHSCIIKIQTHNKDRAYIQGTYSTQP